MYGTKPVKLTREEILKRLSYWDLWSYYIPGVELKKAFISPLRKEKTASASLFPTSDGKLLLKDFGLGTYTIWKFLQEKYGLTYAECLLTINNDFNLGLTTSKNKPTMAYYGIVNPEQPEKGNSPTRLPIKRRNWNKADEDFWGSFYLDIPYIEAHGVLPLENFWINDDLSYWYTEYNPAYSYEFGNSIRKIYLPYNKKMRFIGNVTSDILQGEEYLPWIDDILIITKSYKDVLVLSKLGFNSIAPQGESMYLESQKVKTLKNRFKTIFLLYDNDETGVKYSEKLCEKHSFIPIFVPIQSKVKDISDYIRKYKKEKTLKLIDSWINLKKP